MAIKGVGGRAPVVAGDFDEAASLVAAPLLNGFNEHPADVVAARFLRDDEYRDSADGLWAVDGEHAMSSDEADNLLVEGGHERELARFFQLSEVLPNLFLINIVLQFGDELDEARRVRGLGLTEQQLRSWFRLRRRLRL